MVVETGVEEFEREEKVGTNANTKRTARDEEVIEDEDETQLPEDYEARERVQTGADDKSQTQLTAIVIL